MLRMTETKPLSCHITLKCLLLEIQHFLIVKATVSPPNPLPPPQGEVKVGVDKHNYNQYTLSSKN